jgi:predicted transcriptional regulator of viral defense system
MDRIGGLSGTSRERLAKVLRQTKGVIAADDVAKALSVGRKQATRLLAGWATRGWLTRIRRGLFLPVPLEASTPDIAVEDPWVVAHKVFAPCYIAGWSAAEYWGLTEQLFRSTLVITSRRPRARLIEAQGTSFVVRSVRKRAMFGFKPVWRGPVRVNVSDPTRTILDMLDTPALGGGIRSVIDMLKSYFGSRDRDTQMLVRYADQLGNKAVFKRLGYLVSVFFEGEQEIIDACRVRLSTGNAKLDPKLSENRLVSSWRLWVPEGFSKEMVR